jgi:hypothetical protein
MSFPRLTYLLLPVALGLPLLAGGCGVPIAVSAASYGADGVLVAKTHKTTGDHFASMVTKEDCALWRFFKHQKVCKPRETDHDPYQVSYDEPFRMQAEGAGVSYGPPLNASADAPAVAWEASAYKAPAGNGPQQPSAPTTAIAQTPLDAPAGTPAPTSASGTAAPAQPAPAPVAAAAQSPPKTKKKLVAKKQPKKGSPSQVASAR